MNLAGVQRESELIYDHDGTKGPGKLLKVRNQCFCEKIVHTFDELQAYWHIKYSLPIDLVPFGTVKSQG